MEQVEGRGNGRTVITNLVEIAESLDRPPACKCIKY